MKHYETYTFNMSSIWQTWFYPKDKNISFYLKRKMYDSFTLLVATYGLGSMTITRKVAQLRRSEIERI